MKLEFLVPARGLFGYRNEFPHRHRGEGIMASVFRLLRPHEGRDDPPGHRLLVSFETGESVTYGLFNAQERGTLFIGPACRCTPAWWWASAPSRRTSPSTSARKAADQHAGLRLRRGALRLVPPGR